MSGFNGNHDQLGVEIPRWKALTVVFGGILLFGVVYAVVIFLTTLIMWSAWYW